MTTQTSDDGNYTFALVPPGNYTFAVERQGLKRFVSTKNVVLINQPATVNVSLEVGGVSETITLNQPPNWCRPATDASLSKTFRFTERYSFNLRVDAKNLTNTASFGLPVSVVTTSSFGQIRDSVDRFSRRIQFSGKFNFYFVESETEKSPRN